jgi:hypothetical protein
MPAILALFTQLFRGPLCVLTDSLAERIVLRDLLAKAAAADNLLFVGGASSSDMQLSPFSSRTVRSRTTEKFLRMKAGFVRARSSAVLMPRTLSLRAIRFPTPQISSTGCSESSFRVR